MNATEAQALIDYCAKLAKEAGIKVYNSADLKEV